MFLKHSKIACTGYMFLKHSKMACTEVSRGLAIFRRKENHKSREYSLRNNTRQNYIMQLPVITFILVARSLKTSVHIYNKHHVYAWEEGVCAGLSSSIVCKAACAKAKTIRTNILTGLLSSVINLEIESTASSITVSWSAPFSLDVTGVDPDIWYSVLIYHVTNEGNPTAVPCIDCHNITQSHYVFSPDYLSPCHKYTFTVIPYNGAGEGENVTKREVILVL